MSRRPVSYTHLDVYKRQALFKAVSEGVREFDAIAIVGSKVGETNTLVTGPCGVCRQALYEFGGPELTVIMEMCIRDRQGTARLCPERKFGR